MWNVRNLCGWSFFGWNYPESSIGISLRSNHLRYLHGIVVSVSVTMQSKLNTETIILIINQLRYQGARHTRSWFHQSSSNCHVFLPCSTFRELLIGAASIASGREIRGHELSTRARKFQSKPLLSIDVSLLWAVSQSRQIFGCRSRHCATHQTGKITACCCLTPL